MSEAVETASNGNGDLLARWRAGPSASLTLGGSGNAILVTFEKSNYRLSLPMSSLDYALLKKSVERNQKQTEELKVAFSSHVVTLWGQRLTKVQEALADRSVLVIREAPPSAAFVETGEAVVTEILWVEVERERA